MCLLSCNVRVYSADLPCGQESKAQVSSCSIDRIAEFESRRGHGRTTLAGRSKSGEKTTISFAMSVCPSVRPSLNME